MTSVVMNGYNSIGGRRDDGRRRGMLDMDRIGDSMTRVLHGAGGESTNSLCLTSFIILFVMVLFFAFTGGTTNDITTTTTTTPNKPDNPNTGPMSFEVEPDPTAISYTDDVKHPEWHRQVQPRPTNINLLIIGNATAHYSYLSLVYYLRWGRWFDPGLEKSNLVDENSFDNPFHNQTFGEFHYQTNVLLEPYELCDCHKNAERPHMRRRIYENRYFHDPHHNNTVTYLHAFGDEVVTQGRLNPEDLYTDRWTWSNKEQGLMNPKWDQPKWRYDSWADMIREYASQIQPKPQYALLEAGGFQNSFGPGQGQQEAEAILAALVKEHIHSFWRTTAYDKHHSLSLSENVQDFDDYMCSLMQDCINLAWTEQVRSDLYWDQYFFHEPVHRVLNEELLEAMDKLPEDYVKYNRTLLF